MEADNEPAISLPKSHYWSWSTGIFKMKICSTRTRNKKKESFQRRESKPGPRRYLLPHDNYSRIPMPRTFKGIENSSSYREIELSGTRTITGSKEKTDFTAQ